MSRWRTLLPFDLRRRTVRLLEPGAQLKLPVYLLVMTACFIGAFAYNVHAAFGSLYEAALSTNSDLLKSLVEEQSGRFFVTSAVIGVGYLIAVMVLCAAYLHRLIGPTVALRRLACAMKEGDYAARVKLRKSDAAMAGLATDLNELAQILELEQLKRDSPQA